MCFLPRSFFALPFLFRFCAFFPRNKRYIVMILKGATAWRHHAIMLCIGSFSSSIFDIHEEQVYRPFFSWYRFSRSRPNEDRVPPGRWTIFHVSIEINITFPHRLQKSTSYRIINRNWKSLLLKRNNGDSSSFLLSTILSKNEIYVFYKDKNSFDERKKNDELQKFQRKITNVSQRFPNGREFPLPGGKAPLEAMFARAGRCAWSSFLRVSAPRKVAGRPPAGKKTGRGRDLPRRETRLFDREISLYPSFPPSG